MSALVTSNDTPRASVSGVLKSPLITVPGVTPARKAEPPAETAIVGTGPPLLSGEAVRNIGSISDMLFPPSVQPPCTTEL